jgi:putative tryptophan/tyrosine transport system substrate-binding protein
MKRITTSLLTLALSAALLAGCGGAQPTATSAPGSDSRVYKVGLTQIVEHPSLDTVRQGILDGLKEAGFEDGKHLKVDFQSAQGEMPVAQQIAQKFTADKKDIIIALATPSAQAAAQATKAIPIIFGTVTDPVGAGLVASFDKPGGNVTGTSDMTPVKEQLELFAQLGAKVQKVGVIYNPGEANSVFTVGRAKEAAKALGLTIVEGTVSAAGEVQQTAQSLIGRVDGFYLITDNTLAQGVQSVIALATEKKLPTVSVERSYVDQGALATAGFDYYKLGKQTGAMAAEVLQGKKPADVPVQTSKELSLIVNTKAAQAIGLTVPADLLAKAEKVEQ